MLLPTGDLGHLRSTDNDAPEIDYEIHAAVVDPNASATLGPVPPGDRPLEVSLTEHNTADYDQVPFDLGVVAEGTNPTAPGCSPPYFQGGPTGCVVPESKSVGLAGHDLFFGGSVVPANGSLTGILIMDVPADLLNHPLTFEFVEIGVTLGPEDLIRLPTPLPTGSLLGSADEPTLSSPVYRGPLNLYVGSPPSLDASQFSDGQTLPIPFTIAADVQNGGAETANGVDITVSAAEGSTVAEAPNEPPTKHLDPILGNGPHDRQPPGHLPPGIHETDQGGGNQAAAWRLIANPGADRQIKLRVTVTVNGAPGPAETEVIDVRDHPTSSLVRQHLLARHTAYSACGPQVGLVEDFDPYGATTPAPIVYRTKGWTDWEEWQDNSTGQKFARLVRDHMYTVASGLNVLPGGGAPTVSVDAETVHYVGQGPHKPSKTLSTYGIQEQDGHIIRGAGIEMDTSGHADMDEEWSSVNVEVVGRLVSAWGPNTIQCQYFTYGTGS